jgi:tetratricopeptide (TPR) repeat protein
MQVKRALLVLGAGIILVQPAVAQSWGQLKSQAGEARAAKNFSEAVNFWKQALSACENTGGPRYIQSMSGLAGTYADQEKYVDADACYQKIVELSGSAEVSEDMKAALLDYAAVLRKQKKDSQAADLEKKFALKAPVPAATPASEPVKKTAVADPGNEMAKMQALLTSGTKEAALKHYAPAEQFFKQALAASESHAEAGMIKSESLSRLISLFQEQNKWAAVEPVYRQLLSLKRASESQSKDYAHLLMDYGRVLRKLDRKPEAMAQEAIAERILAKFNQGGGAAGSAAAAPQAQYNDPGATRRGSIYQRARTAQKGFDGATNQAINSED